MEVGLNSDRCSIVSGSISKVWKNTALRPAKGVSSMLCWKGVRRKAVAAAVQCGRVPSVASRRCLWGMQFMAPRMLAKLCNFHQGPIVVVGRQCRPPKICVCRDRRAPLVLLMVDMQMGKQKRPRAKPTLAKPVRLRKFVTPFTGKAAPPAGYNSLRVSGAVDPQHAEWLVYESCRVQVRYVVEVDVKKEESKSVLSWHPVGGGGVG